MPWSVALALVGLAGAIIALGWPVRAYTHGKRRDVDRLRAARVFALAKACALVGSGLAGLYGAACAEALRVTATPYLRERALAAGAAAVAAVALAAAGCLVERFCALPPADGEVEEAAQNA
jgi:hypothetical protein